MLDRGNPLHGVCAYGPRAGTASMVRQYVVDYGRLQGISWKFADVPCMYLVGFICDSPIITHDII